MRETSVQFTPLEVQLLFELFGDGNGRISLEHFEELYDTREGHVPTSDQQWTMSRVLSVAKDGSLNFMLGAVAGGIGALVVYPIDLVKTRMQNQRNAGPGVKQHYRNSLDCFLKVVQREGTRGLYRGLGPQLIGVAPEKAIKLTVNDLLRSTFSGLNQGNIDFPLEVLAGAGAGASQVIFTNPLEIVKIRLQVAGEAGAPRSSVQVVKELGFLGLYRGAAACLLRDIPFSAIYFPTYAKMKGYLSEEDGRAVVSCGGLLRASSHTDVVPRMRAFFWCTILSTPCVFSALTHSLVLLLLVFTTGTVSPTTMLLAGTIAGCPAAGLTTPAGRHFIFIVSSCRCCCISRTFVV
jgi:solute carrier family 25 (mitochondrial aspartate/glutamate transporter), member 12/13